ncbi:MAG: DUF1461 domain-containing protein [Aristaeellaceae bacterium]
MGQIRPWLARAAGFLLALAMATLMLAALIDGLGTSAPLMLSIMRRCAPAAQTGFPDAQYPGMTAMMTAYLAGDTDTFQYTWTAEDGVTYMAFRDREQQHMADCRALFVLCRGVLMTAAAVIGLALAVCLALHRARETAQGLLIGTGCVLLLAVTLALWGWVDFDSLFVLFHRLSFDNELWLMDPATELLIRLMPISFFITYAALLLGSWLGGMLLMLLTAIGIMKHSRR